MASRGEKQHDTWRGQRSIGHTEWQKVLSTKIYSEEKEAAIIPVTKEPSKAIVHKPHRQDVILCSV